MSDLKAGDRVSVTIDGKTHEAKLSSIKPNSQIARIVLDGSSKEIVVKVSELVKLRRGFKQYNIIWKTGEKNQSNVNFRFTVIHNEHKVEFHGWWRKTDVRTETGRAECYAVDMFCKWGDKSYSLATIPYFTEDPRNDLPSLSADITAAANEFIWKKLQGKFEVIDEITRMAANPIVRITSLRTLDMLIAKLTEHRAASIQAGGPRHCDIKSDNDEAGVRVVFAIDLTKQHMVLEGRVPSLIEGAVYDTASKGKKGGEKLEIKMDQGNLDALVAQLKAAKEKGDDTAARKIRATLRKLGHKGGARSASK